MLKLYNTMNKQKTIFKPTVDNKISLYVCGVTVYDYCHIGNARVYLVFDVLVRYLKFLNYEVNYTRNITDIDDKIINRAHAENKKFTEIAAFFTAAFQEDMRRLKVLTPTHEPRATDYVMRMIAMIGVMVDKGIAYKGDNGDIYYDISQFNAYGQLSHQDLAALRSGERVAVSVAKRDPLDFVLWKLAKPGEPAWNSPWGAGRPGWHIECSAMALDCLNGIVDIHGGGLDLIFPHHENEIAQSEAVTECNFVNQWMHVGFVQLDQKKMSKSLKNFFTVRDVCANYDPEVVRYFILASHYRSPLCYSEANLQQAKAALVRLYRALDAVILPSTPLPLIPEYKHYFKQAMDDDLNTPGAIAVLFQLAHEINKFQATIPEKTQQLADTLRQLANLLGLLAQEPSVFLQGNNSILVEQIEALLSERDRARSLNDWSKADQLRLQLENLGILIEDTPSGSVWRKK